MTIDTPEPRRRKTDSQRPVDPQRARVIHAALEGLGPTKSYLSGARILVTGARGFFGRYVVDALLAMNEYLQTKLHVSALDSLLMGDADNWGDWRGDDNITFLRHDVRHDMSGLSAGAFGGFTHIWHLAGIASPFWYQKLPRETIDVAVEGTKSMLALAKANDAHFLFTSSSEVYQTASVNPTPETYIGAIPSLTERSCYDVSKLMAETLCYVAAHKDETDVSIVRIFNSFGPGMSEKDKRILPRIASAVKAKQPMMVYGNPQYLPRRTYTPVANTLLGLLMVACKGETIREPKTASAAPGVYNLGLDSPEITVPELLARIEMVTGETIPYELRAPPSNYTSEPMRRCPDITKLKGLGFMPCMDLDTGLKGFFDWARDVYTGL